MIEVLQEAINKQDNKIWNKWKKTNDNPIILQNIRFLDLTTEPLRGFNFTGVEFQRCDFEKLEFHKCQFQRATFRTNIQSCDLIECDFKQSTFYYSQIKDVDFTESMFSTATFCECTLENVNFFCASLIFCNFFKGSITNCSVFGSSVWDIRIYDTVQSKLSIEPYSELSSKGRCGSVTVDDIELAQFINLILNNSKIGNVFNTVTSKIVLILGRFTQARKQVLDSIRNELRNKDFTPIIFDFDKPQSRNLTETVSTLAHMSRFIVADLTAAKSIPQELQRIAPDLPNVPIQPILLKGKKAYAMFESFRDYPWVLQTYIYKNSEHLISTLMTNVIEPAELLISQKHAKNKNNQ